MAEFNLTVIDTYSVRDLLFMHLSVIGLWNSSPQHCDWIRSEGLRMQMIIGKL